MEAMNTGKRFLKIVLVKQKKSLDMNEIDKDLKMYSKGKTC